MSGNKVTVIDQVRHGIELMGPEFAKVLPSHISSEKFIRVAQTAILDNPNLLACDRRSLYAACTRAAQDGLLPDGREGAIVPFKDKAQWMPMIAGILKRIRNSGELHSIVALVVCEEDEFEYWVDTDGEHVKHKPILFQDAGDIIGVYALAKTKDGGVYIEAMSVAQVEKVRAVSKAKNAGTWSQWWDEMAKKTVLRRLSKRLPMNTDNLDLIQRDDELTDLGSTAAQNLLKPPQEIVQPQKKQSRLASAIEAVAVQEERDQTIGIEAAEQEPPQELTESDKAAMKVDEEMER